MATTQKKTTGGSRAASGRSGSASRSGGSRKKAPAPRPIRREVGAGACLLLASPDLTITEIAYRCGFNDSSYFVKTFRKYMGITPRAYAHRR